MIVCVEASFFELFCLRQCQHSERYAGLHAKRLHVANHTENTVKLFSFRNLPPRRPHAKPVRSCLLCLRRCSEHIVHRQQSLALEAGFIMRGLRTITTVLGTSSGFDRKKETPLYIMHVVKAEMCRMCTMQKIEKRKAVQMQGTCQVAVNAQCRITSIVCHADR